MGRFWNHDGYKCMLRGFLVCAIVSLQWLQLEYSPVAVRDWSFLQSEMLILMNLGWISLLNLVLVLILQKWEISLSIMSILCGVWSIVGYYVTVYHGSPLCFTMLRNAGTAMDVAGNYTYAVDVHVAVLLALSAAQTGLLILLGRIKVGSGFSWKRFAFRVGVLAANCLFLYITLFDATPIKPQRTIGWQWSLPMNVYGYTCCLAEDLGNLLDPYTVPDGYDPGQIVWEDPDGTVPEQCPDVILILNETFFDLARYSDIQADRDIFAPFYALDNAVLGHAVTPVAGGGTNNAEFELLTSNSMYLLNADAPFHYVDFAPENSNVVRYFEDLGYTTWGMHCITPTNYARNRVYPQLGFDHVLLGKEAFQYVNPYGDRWWLDSDNYRDLTNQYESAGDGPRFLYLLTYQNHGGYEQNDATLDTVHAANVPESLSGQVDEYLTSVDLSVQAFLELTAYFAAVDRPVILCMVGDHGPSFIEQLEPKAVYSPEEASIAARATPYVIWANFPLDTGAGGSASMVDLVPMVLEQAGLPLTPYYDTILDLREQYPIRTSDGLTVDRAGSIEAYTYGDPEWELLTQYYYMEYNGLITGRDFAAELFSVPFRQAEEN